MCYQNWQQLTYHEVFKVIGTVNKGQPRRVFDGSLRRILWLLEHALPSCGGKKLEQRRSSKTLSRATDSDCALEIDEVREVSAVGLPHASDCTVCRIGRVPAARGSSSRRTQGKTDVLNKDYRESVLYPTYLRILRTACICCSGFILFGVHPLSFAPFPHSGGFRSPMQETGVMASLQRAAKTTLAKARPPLQRNPEGCP